MSHQSVPTAYLDSNLIIGLRKGDLGPEQASLIRLLEANKRETLKVVTSAETRKEIEKRTPVDEVEAIIYSLLVDVPAVEGEELFLPVITNRGGSRLIGPVTVVKDEDLAFLRETLPDAPDANHVFQAISNDVDYFVTCDKKTILAHAAEIEATTDPASLAF